MTVSLNSPGDDFEVLIEVENTITLVSRPANSGLVDLLFACPSPFEVPERERDFNHLEAVRS